MDFVLNQLTITSLVIGLVIVLGVKQLFELIKLALDETINLEGNNQPYLFRVFKETCRDFDVERRKNSSHKSMQKASREYKNYLQRLKEEAAKFSAPQSVGRKYERVDTIFPENEIEQKRKQFISDEILEAEKNLLATEKCIYDMTKKELKTNFNFAKRECNEYLQELDERVHLKKAKQKTERQNDIGFRQVHSSS